MSRLLLYFQQACKPGSVSRLSPKGAIRDLYHLSDRPTPRHRASNPCQPVYMVFQPRRRASSGVTPGHGELLPHLLTLTPADRGGYFLPRFYALSNIFLPEVWRSLLPGLSFPRFSSPETGER
jgi:hypothetical protein